jgi:membrane fusion protein (multidrug efflux system)
MIVLVILFVAGLGYIKFRQIQQGMAMGKLFAPPPPAVTTQVAKLQSWQPVLSAVGSIKAVNGVTMSTDLPGIITEIDFESGAMAKKGDLLVRLDTRQEQAQQDQAQAKLDFDKLNLARQKDLLVKKAISQSDYDTAETSYKQDDAAVENAKALVARKTIIAPFDGKLGIRQVSLGQYLNAGTPIVPLQSVDPVYADFSLPQQQLGNIAVGKKVRIKASGLDQDFEGEITSIDSLVDLATRNVTVEATVKNPDAKLSPGMFVSVEVLLPQQEGVISIPATAINYAPYGNSVFIVKQKPGEDGKMQSIAEEQFVKTGPSRGDQVSVLSGVKAGDEVVTSGVFKVRGGAPVNINNAVQPGDESNPKPPDT